VPACCERCLLKPGLRKAAFLFTVRCVAPVPNLVSDSSHLPASQHQLHNVLHLLQSAAVVTQQLSLAGCLLLCVAESRLLACQPKMHTVLHFLLVMMKQQLSLTPAACIT
jgi:hypothetical protein